MAEHVAFAAPVALSGGALRGAAVCASGARSGGPCLAAPAARAAAPQMAFSSIEGVLTGAPVTLPCDTSLVVSAVYRQVLGNAHLMESEAQELRNAESEFRMFRDVREFVRAVAKSDAYVSRFVEPVSAFRTTELLFKHLLGRGPRSKAEYGAVMGVMQSHGFPAVVDWFVDSAEYEESFGSWTVPYGIFRGQYPTNEEFNRAVAMRGTNCSSDKARSTMLQYAVCSGDSPSWLTVAKNLPAGTEKGTGFSPASRWASSKWNKAAPNRIGTKVPGGVVFND